MFRRIITASIRKRVTKVSITRLTLLRIPLAGLAVVFLAMGLPVSNAAANHEFQLNYFMNILSLAAADSSPTTGIVTLKITGIIGPQQHDDPIEIHEFVGLVTYDTTTASDQSANSDASGRSVLYTPVTIVLTVADGDGGFEVDAGGNPAGTPTPGGIVTNEISRIIFEEDCCPGLEDSLQIGDEANGQWDEPLFGGAITEFTWNIGDADGTAFDNFFPGDPFGTDGLLYVPDLGTLENFNGTITLGELAPTTCIAAPAGLVSWWPMDGSTNDIIDDNSASATSGLSFVGGKVGDAVQIDSGGFIDVAPSANLRNQQYTIDAWVRPDGIGPNDDAFGSVIVAKSFTGGESSAILNWAQDPDGRFVYSVGVSANQIESTNIFPPGQFYHVAATYYGQEMKLFVDGVLEASRSITLTVPYTSSLTWNIGVTAATFRSNFARTWDGLIDEVEIYNRALLQSEIQAIFNAGSTGKCKLTTEADININIHPTSFPSPVNVCKSGLGASTPVTIWGDGIDVAQIDLRTLRLGNAELKTKGQTPNCSVADIGAPNSSEAAKVSCDDETNPCDGADWVQFGASGDGSDDLTCHFYTKQIGADTIIDVDATISLPLTGCFCDDGFVNPATDLYECSDVADPTVTPVDCGTESEFSTSDEIKLNKKCLADVLP